MSKNSFHSNTPEFVSLESQTSKRLYQHPKQSEMKVSFAEKVKAVVREIAVIAIVFSCAAAPIFLVRSCSDDVERQHAKAVSHQEAFKEINQ